MRKQIKLKNYIQLAQLCITRWGDEGVYWVSIGQQKLVLGVVSPYDVLIDITGSAMGISAFMYWKKKVEIWSGDTNP